MDQIREMVTEPEKRVKPSDMLAKLKATMSVMQGLESYGQWCALLQNLPNLIFKLPDFQTARFLKYYCFVKEHIPLLSR